MVSAGKDDFWMADLMDMVKFDEWNDAIIYILLVIDTLSQYVWLRLLKFKTGDGRHEYERTSLRSREDHQQS